MNHDGRKMATNKSSWTKGIISNTPFVCQYTDTTYRAIVNNEYDPLDYTTPTILVELITIFLASRATYLVLRLFRQNLFASQIIAGILIGPSFLGQNRVIRDKLFPPRGTLILKTLGYFGLMFHLFRLGVNTSPTMFKGVRKKIVYIGLSSFFFGVGVGFMTLFILRQVFKTRFENFHMLGLPIILTFNSVSPYIVVTSLLIELNIINSELGNLASSVSLVTDVCGWSLASFVGNTLRATQNQDFRQASLTITCIVGYYLIIVFILRPLVVYISKSTPEGQPMSETHFFIIITIVLGVGYCGEVVGQTAALGAFVFGLVLPDGLPLGMTLIEKFDTFTSSILFPLFCTVSGLRTDFRSLNRVSSPFIELVLLMGYLGKFLGTLIPTILLGEMSLDGALPLALVLWCKGVIELASYGSYKDSRIISDEVFALALVTMLIITGISVPLVKYLYDPSATYLFYNGQTIQKSSSNGALKILVCIYKEDNAPSIINLLQLAKPTKETPLRVFVLQLFELVGHKRAILAPYDQGNKKKLSDSEHIVTAFEIIEKGNINHLRIQHFTAITPYATMHNDICTIAYDRGVNIIILPFHLNKGIDKMIDISSTNIRNANRRVLRKAPCSVGILIDRSGAVYRHHTMISGLSFYLVAILFFGGADDHEALAYGRRLVEDSNIKLTVIRVQYLVDNGERNRDVTLDDLVIAEFLASTKNKWNLTFKDMMVEDVVGTTKIIRSIEDNVDLVLVGRYHDPHMPSITGLIDWSEWPELGAIGAMLITWDFQFSVLVVQQHTKELITCCRQQSNNSLCSTSATHPDENLKVIQG